jgi:hypothetical protein
MQSQESSHIPILVGWSSALWPGYSSRGQHCKPKSRCFEFNLLRRKSPRSEWRWAMSIDCCFLGPNHFSPKMLDERKSLKAGDGLRWHRTTYWRWKSRSAAAGHRRPWTFASSFARPPLPTSANSISAIFSVSSTAREAMSRHISTERGCAKKSIAVGRIDSFCWLQPNAAHVQALKRSDGLSGTVRQFQSD